MVVGMVLTQGEVVKDRNLVPASKYALALKADSYL
jgi:hypothetical protein